MQYFVIYCIFFCAMRSSLVYFYKSSLVSDPIIDSANSVMLSAFDSPTPDATYILFARLFGQVGLLRSWQILWGHFSKIFWRICLILELKCMKIKYILITFSTAIENNCFCKVLTTKFIQSWYRDKTFLCCCLGVSPRAAFQGCFTGNLFEGTVVLDVSIGCSGGLSRICVNVQAAREGNEKKISLEYVWWRNIVPVVHRRDQPHRQTRRVNVLMEHFYF